MGVSRANFTSLFAARAFVNYVLAVPDRPKTAAQMEAGIKPTS